MQESTLLLQSIAQMENQIHLCVCVEGVGEGRKREKSLNTKFLNTNSLINQSVNILLA